MKLRKIAKNTPNSEIIEIIKGHEYRYLLDDIYKKEKFFYPVYSKSAELIGEIIEYQNINKEHDVNVYSNNIIMFCADRGGGKTTAMRSFAHALRQLDENNGKNRLNEIWKNKLLNCDFTVLDVIDPTAAGSESEGFMRVVLSRMFSSIRDLNNKSDKELSNHIKQEIFEKFNKCYKLLEVIYNDKCDTEFEDDLDELAELGDSSSLKEAFRGLVDMYLKILIGAGAGREKFLVMQIDDADLSPNTAYSIIEDIRRYCMIPNVIILMAVNIDQMHHVIEQHFVKQFKDLIDIASREGNIVKSISYKNCRDMAVKYIDKVMPAAHQVFLPDIDDHIRNSESVLTVKYVQKLGQAREVFDLFEKYTKNKDSDKSVIFDYQERILRLIYEKTGIALIKPENYVHNLIPQSMRELSHFLSYMFSLEDICTEIGYAQIHYTLTFDGKVAYPAEKDGKRIAFDYEKALEQLNIRRRNLEALEKYFIKTWCDINLTMPYKHVIDELSATVSDHKISAATEWCARLFNDAKGSPFEGIEKFVNDFEPKLSKNSYAYLLDYLKVISDNAHCSNDFSEIYKFVYAVRFYFTLFFNRNILSIISKGEDLTHLLKLANYEMWVPHYENLTNCAVYGRYEVDYNIMTDKIFRSELLNIDSPQYRTSDIYNTLKRNCYISINGKNYELDLNEPLVSEALEAIKTSREMKNPPKLIFDNGTSVLYESLSYSDFSSSDENFTVKNTALQLASGWDIQHAFEKGFARRDRVWEEPFKWRESLLTAGENRMNEADYLPVTWLLLSFRDDEYLLKLQFCNEKSAIMTVKKVWARIKERLSVVVNNPGVGELMSKVIPIITEISDLMGYLLPVREFSAELDEVFENFSEAKEIYEKISNIASENEKISDEDKQRRIMNLLPEAETALKVFKKRAEEPETLSEIINDIKIMFAAP